MGVPNTTKQPDRHTKLGVGNDDTLSPFANDNDPPEEERQKQMFRELREIGWYDKEIRGPHHDQALRGWWGKEAPALVSIVTGQTPTDPAANND